MPFLELSLHITDQHLDPWSSWQERPEREEKFRDVQTAMETFHDRNTCLLCVLTLPKEPWPRTLSNSNWDGSAFSQPSFTWWVIGISLYVPSSYTNSISMRLAHKVAGMSICMQLNRHMLHDLKPIITYTVQERLSLLHGLVHDLMSIELQPDQQISSEESATVNTFTKLVHPCFQLSRTMTAAPARPHVWWNIQQMKSMSHMQ